MRYEMIFGDEKLFDRVNRDDVVIVCESKHDNRHFYAVEDAIEYLRNKKDFTPEVAMRRIIKEPKRWTWEDKKAGVLPEVGAQCKDRSFLFKVINVTDKYVVIETMQSGDVYSLPHQSFMSSCEPIETPAEKAQREEDEFVELIMCENTPQKTKSLFEFGIRAAYRKLKGGER